MKKSITCITLAAIVCSIAGSALAQRKPEAVIKERQSLMTMQNWVLRDLSMMVKGQRPYDKEVVTRSAALLDATGKMIPEVIPPGTGPESGVATRARPEVWTDAEKFKQALERFQAETPKLTEAAGAGTLDALRGAFSGVLKGCDNCHDSFRAKR
jgi:cytochrome c556